MASGFKKEVRENIALLNNTSTRVDIELATGSVNETVLVTTAPPLLQTDRADISTKIEARDVADLPLGTNRNFQSLLNLVPGTTPATFQHSQFFNAQSALQTQANGIPRMGNLHQIEALMMTNAPACSRSSFLLRRLSRPSTYRPTTLRPSWAGQSVPYQRHSQVRL